MSKLPDVPETDDGSQKGGRRRQMQAGCICLGAG